MNASRPSVPLLIVATVAMAVGQRAAAEESLPHVAGDNPVEEKLGEPRVLDLRAPDITRIYTPEQINAFLARAERDDEDEAVEVEGTREPPPTVTPKVWSGIAAPFWALLHPTQAWRIFLPWPPDQARGKDQRPDATLAHYEPDIPLR